MDNVNILNRFNLNSAILSIHKTKNGVSLVTQDYQACVIENNILKSRTKLLSSPKIPHKFAKSNSVSERFVCVCNANSIDAVIAKIDSTIKKIAQISSHKKAISASNFSSDSSILATGGEDGRVFLYTTSNFKKILSLPYRPDYISSINFSSDSRFIIVSCFNKSNVIFDIKRAKTINIFNTSEVVEWGDFFDNNTKLLLITRDFQSIIYDVSTKEIISSANLFSSWPNIFCIDEVAKIAIVGTRDGGIYLVNITENTIIFHLRLEQIVGVSAICLHLGCIFLGGINGEVLIISYTDNNEQFKNACEAKDYANASKMLESNIFLSLLPCAKVFDNDWEDILKEAIVLLGEDKIDDAIALTNPFTKQDISKKNAFGVYLEKKDSVKKFKELVDNRFFEEAYNMTLNAKFLTKTTYYETLEDTWHKAFNTARKILEDNPNNTDLAKRHLEIFLKTPKKDTAMQLLNNLHIFEDADNFIKEQNFKDYFALVGNFAYLKECTLYKKVLALGANFFDKLLEAKNADNYDEFERIATFLLNFPFYKESIANMNIVVGKKRDFLRLIAENNITEVYKLALEYEELQYLDEFKQMSADFENIAQKALESAHNGDVSALSDIFGTYLQISFWSDRIKSIFQVAYLAEFEKSINTEKTAINWEQSIKNYIQIFGKDDDILAFCKNNGFDYEFGDFYKHIFSFQKTLISRVV